MKLRDILIDVADIPAPAGDAVVAGVTADSRKVRPGEVFFALSGARTDGARFIGEARSAGAAAIVCDREAAAHAGSGAIGVANPRRALALAASRFYPSQPGMIATVTGTSGKTSVAAFTRQIWTRLGHAAASIGTVGLVTPSRAVYGSLTTPDPVTLHRTLDDIAGEGVTHLALEASSHGLDQYRLDGVRVRIAAFTNLSRDHMDYHATVEDYFAAKLRLFTELVAADGAAVVAADHAESQAVIEAVRARGLRTVTVGRAGKDIRLADAALDGFAQHLRIAHRDRRYDVRLPLAGAFQVENALVAAGLAIASGDDAEAVFDALARLEGAKGRLEQVGERNGAPVFIDYAHKPDALAKALEALRPYAQRRLVVVFGAGGDRDQGKRPLMGAIAAEKADAVIITDDNPRSENPADIRAAIARAAPGASEIADRAAAIRFAIAGLRPGDALLIAGKGHETGQIVGDRVLPFSDHEAVAAALAEEVA
jgi:UDP-N-acetylmuramoyl-L-alanyl-D-glutamate--2,6-diaminopimelate ligase